MRKLPIWMKKSLRVLPVLLLLLVNSVLPLGAQSPTQAPVAVRVITTSDGVHLEWGSSTGDMSEGVVAAAALQSLPLMHFQGYDLPMQLVTVQLPPQGQATALQIDQLTSTKWQKTLQPSGPLQPPAPKQ